jgi:hypothetical protein
VLLPEGRLLALPAYIIQLLKRGNYSNVPAYYGAELNPVVKSFIE